MGIEQYMDMIRSEFKLKTMGYFEFMDIFATKETCEIIEAQPEWETLSTALMTMKALDQKQVNRLGFAEFCALYQSLELIPEEVSVTDDFDYNDPHSLALVEEVYNRYTDESGLITIEGLFRFCKDET